MNKTSLKVTFVNPNENQNEVVTALATLFATCLYKQMKSDDFTDENNMPNVPGQKCS